MDLAMYLRPDDLDVNGNPVDPAVVGLYNVAMAPETLVEVRFDPETGVVKDLGRFREDWTFNLQLSAMDWSLEGQSAPTLHHVVYQGSRPGRISARAARLYEDRIDRDLLRSETPGALATFRRGSLDLVGKWEYEDLNDLITSPTFVPRPAPTGTHGTSYAGANPGGHDGWVVQPVFNDDGFRVELFDAARVAAGPVAILRGDADQRVPLLLHSAWMPTTEHLVDAERLSFSDELTDARRQSVPEEHRHLLDLGAADLAD